MNYVDLNEHIIYIKSNKKRRTN